MTDAPVRQSTAKTQDTTKGKQYRALHNVGFGKDRAQVPAGQIFNLDDADVAKELLAKGAISEDLKPGQPADRTAEEINRGEPANAAKVRGDAADAAAAQGKAAKS
jgi:hypothetical protein